MSKWIRKGDKVVVIAGNEKGRVGEVFSKNKDFVFVQGVNIRKKHVKRKTQMATQNIIEIEAPIHISNVMISSNDDKPVKLKVKIDKDGHKKLFYYYKGKEVIYRECKKKK